MRHRASGRRKRSLWRCAAVGSRPRRGDRRHLPHRGTRGLPPRRRAHPGGSGADAPRGVRRRPARASGDPWRSSRISRRRTGPAEFSRNRHPAGRAHPLLPPADCAHFRRRRRREPASGPYHDLLLRHRRAPSRRSIPPAVWRPLHRRSSITRPRPSSLPPTPKPPRARRWSPPPWRWNWAR